MPTDYTPKFQWNEPSNNYSNLLLFLCILFTMPVVFFSFNGSILLPLTFQPVVAQNASIASPNVNFKALFDNATNSLQNGNTNDSKNYLYLIRSGLEQLDQNSSLPWVNTKLLIDDAIDSINNNNVTNTLIYLDLAVKNLGADLQGGFSGNAGFKTYDNSIVGIQMLYPQNWTVIEYPYNPSSNNTIVGFYSDVKTSSELGNVSGVSGNFVPYLDLYEFDSKNMSLTDLHQNIQNKFNNNTNFAVEGSKPVPLKNDRDGFEIIYDVTVGSEEHLKKIQVYTIIDDKAYTISFSSQRDLFADYLPTIHKMINSFDSTNKNQ
jgi:PsbP-like protein